LPLPELLTPSEREQERRRQRRLGNRLKLAKAAGVTEVLRSLSHVCREHPEFYLSRNHLRECHGVHLKIKDLLYSNNAARANQLARTITGSGREGRPNQRPEGQQPNQG
jgi:hypothetical protein